jgi:hypothetical protein
MVALLLVPFFVGLAVLILYRQNGKKQFLKMDLVQFVYSFIVFPVLFIWGKSFLFYLLRYDAQRLLSPGEMFVLDTALSTILLYLYAFLIMHSLTKTFNLRRFRDPLYDIFTHSEYFHLWLTHLAMFFGMVTLVVFISAINIWMPFQMPLSKTYLGATFGLGSLFGLLLFAYAWLSNPEQGQFFRIVKLIFGLALVVHIVLYFWVDPPLNMSYALYWLCFMIFGTATFCSFLFERSAKAQRFANWFKHPDWEKQKVHVFGQDRGQIWQPIKPPLPPDVV